MNSFAIEIISIRGTREAVMELITAQTLWKDYDPRSLPLGETVLFTENLERYTVKHVYFNGEATGDGCTRSARAISLLSNGI